MQLSKPNPLPVEPFYSKGLTKRLAALNERIAAHAAKVDQHATYRAKMHNQPVTEFDFDSELGVKASTCTVAILLGDELPIRREYAACLPLIAVELRAQADRKLAECEQVRGEVHAALLKLGYADFVAEPIPGRLFPAWIAGHPRVLALAAEVESLQSRSNSLPAGENDAAIRRAEQSLEELRRQALANA